MRPLKSILPRLRERRRSPRYACAGPIDFRIQGWYLRRGRILNLCLDGCLIEPQLNTGYLIDDQLDLRFEVNGQPFRAQCVVRRIESTGLLGVEILHLSDRNRRHLRELIAELATLSPPIGEHL
ncbi:MAG TPA: PilZ domain-containing protein [Edaphobacter sp.]